MQDTIECNWFKASKHDVIHSQQNINLRSSNPTKIRNKNKYYEIQSQN